MDFLKYNKERVISKNISLLEILFSDKVKDLIRCSLYKVVIGENFSSIEGALLIELYSGRIIGLNGQDELNSIVTWLEKSEKGEVNEDYYLNDNEIYPYTLAEYSEDLSSMIINKKAAFIDVVYQQYFSNYKYMELPNEVGIIVGFEEGGFMTLTHYLFNQSNDLDLKITSNYPMIDTNLFKIQRISPQ
ncbi:hypothetical protein V6R21_11270 [Limibacter armeniacum]|uniref:hypothetical protein n=1 Tax=Limibacter armeniacum TaxID=466084 RepID=UPI002FE5E34C